MKQPKRRSGKTSQQPGDIVNFPEPSEIVESLSNELGRDLEPHEAIAFLEFIRTKDLTIAAKSAGISEAEITMMVNEPWWQVVSNKFLKSYQEVFVHRLMGEMKDLINSLNKGAKGGMEPKTYKNHIEHAKLLTELGRDEMKPLKSTKHEVDIRSETIEKKIQITADMADFMTSEELMEFTLYGKLPDRKLINGGGDENN
jgi:hypothetical protein